MRIQTKVPFTTALILLGLGLLVSSAYEPFHGAGGRIPAEWIVLGVWAALGLAFFQAAAPMRREVSEEERRRLILDARDE